MKNFIKNFIIITIPTIILCSILAELFFRFIIPASYPPRSCFDENELLYKNCLHQDSMLITYGKWASPKIRWKINNCGWNSDIDYYREKSMPRIAIIGDSYIEAFQVPLNKSYPALLRHYFQDKYEVYSFGKSGYPLSQYLHVSRYVNQNFSPDIIIFNIVHNDFDESILDYNSSDFHFLTVSLTDKGVKENTPIPNYSFQKYNWKKRLMFKSALARYILLNLNGNEIMRNLFSSFSLGGKNNAIETYNANINANIVKTRRESIIIATHYIISRIIEENKDKRVIFVMDAPRFDIYLDRLKQSSVLFLHEIIEKLCTSFQIELVDLTTPMEKDYENFHKPFNSKIDGHWNEYGHTFVAKQLLQQLNKK